MMRQAASMRSFDQLRPDSARVRSSSVGLARRYSASTRARSRGGSATMLDNPAAYSLASGDRSPSRRQVPDGHDIDTVPVSLVTSTLASALPVRTIRAVICLVSPATGRALPHRAAPTAWATLLLPAAFSPATNAIGEHSR